HIQYAKFLRRYSRPKESVQIVKQATEKATNIYEKINAEIELVKSLWSNGLQQKAYNKLQEMDTTLIKEITSNEVLEISYYHACCLVLHDLDKNKQVIQYAQKCIDKY